MDSTAQQFVPRGETGDCGATKTESFDTKIQFCSKIITQDQSIDW